MSRAVPESRFEDLIDAATRVFIENGYRRTQMADVADAMGIAKGTVYLYVESKEALFDLACRFSDAPRPLAPPPSFPVRTPPPGATVEYITERLARSPVLPLMRSLIEKKKRGDAGFEAARSSNAAPAVLAPVPAVPAPGSSRYRRGISL